MFLVAGTYSINYNSEMLQKNLNADLTNPNVYNSIEDPLKEEHVYDEIKQKEGYKDPGKWNINFTVESLGGLLFCFYVITICSVENYLGTYC